MAVAMIATQVITACETARTRATRLRVMNRTCRVTHVAQAMCSDGIAA